MRASYPGIDLIRLSAAFIVVAYHLGFSASRDGPLAWACSAGWVGVPVFFVVSGFVIALTAEGRTAGQFALSRFLRLYPAAWICASITFLVAGGTWAEFGRSVILFPLGPWIDNVYWTVAVELVFYALVFVALWRSGDLRELAAGLGLYSSAFWVLKAIRIIDLTGIENYAGFLLLAHDGVFFAIGMCLWQKRPRLAVSFSVIGFGAVLARSHAITEVEVAPFFVPAAIWLAALMLIVFSSRRPALWSVRTLGLMTYPLYLVHNEVGRVIKSSAAPLGQAAAFAIATFAVITISFLILPLERRIRRLLRRSLALGSADLE